MEHGLNNTAFKTNSTKPNKTSYFKTYTFNDISIDNCTFDIPKKMNQMHINEMNNLKLMDIRFLPKNSQFSFNTDHGSKSSKKNGKVLPYLKYKNQSNQKIINQMRRRNKEIEEQFKKLLPKKNHRKSYILNTVLPNDIKKEKLITKIPAENKRRKYKSVNNLKQYFINKNNDLVQKKMEYSEKINKNKLDYYKNQYNLMNKLKFNESDYEKEEQDKEDDIHKLINKNKRLFKFLNEKEKECKKNKQNNDKEVNNSRNFEYIHKNTMNDINLLNIDKNTSELPHKLYQTTGSNTFRETTNNNKKRLCPPPLNLNDIGINTIQNFKQATIDNTNIVLKNNKNHQNIKKLYSNKILKNINSKSVHKKNSINKDNDLIDINDLLSEFDIKMNPVYLREIKDKTKLKRFLYYYKIMKTERGINESYENNNDSISERKNKVIKMKNKCKNILKELDRKNNFNLDQFVREFKRSELAMTFKDFFYNYLLIILENYDKKIVPETFEIKKESKEQQNDVKYCNFIKRHRYFKKVLNDQFKEGIQANNLVENFIIKNETNEEK